MPELFAPGPVYIGPVLGDNVAPNIHALSYELADEGRGLKVVYQALRDDGVVATFETGSFLDKGGGQVDEDKHDICVSTAGGCTRSCRMCSVPNAEIGFERLLTTDEIVAQVIHAVNVRNPNGELPNVVGMMGNGEPPDNPALFSAIEILADIKKHDSHPLVDRFTISTIGENTRGIVRLAKNCASLDATVKLQFSLHVVDETKRRQIIPGRAPLGRVLQTIDEWTVITGEPVKHNVVLMDGVRQYEGFSNATAEDAHRLAAHLLALVAIDGVDHTISRRLKLSAFNPIPGIPFVRPPEKNALTLLIYCAARASSR